MGQLKAVFDGGVVAEPEYKEFDSGARVLSFPVYVNRRRKNKDSGAYEDTGDVTKVRVQLWNDAADEADVQKGDIVEVTGSLYEREYEGKNGKGRALETDFVDSVVLKFRKEGSSGGSSGGGGFFPDGDSPGGFS